MERFQDFTGMAVPYVSNNIDTDTIIPKQFLTSVTKTGYGLFLFNDLRWLSPAVDASTTAAELEPHPDFVLNQKRYQGAEILITGANFACGSSREHAVWALAGYGFKAIIAQSFADIFSSNSSKNGLLLINFPAATIEELVVACQAEEGYAIKVVLSVEEPYVEASGKRHPFDVDAGVKERLLEGLDEISITEKMQERIKEYEQQRLQAEPWLAIGPHLARRP